MRLALCVMVCTFIGGAQDMGVVRTAAENKFEPIPNIPSCIKMSVQSGDPAKGPSVLLLKGTAGCEIAWHWHTPTEQVMMVSGKAKVEMKDGKSGTIGPGGFAMMPSKHVHRFTCLTECTAFVSSDATFDIHYVDKGTD